MNESCSSECPVLSVQRPPVGRASGPESGVNPLTNAVVIPTEAGLTLLVRQDEQRFGAHRDTALALGVVEGVLGTAAHAVAKHIDRGDHRRAGTIFIGEAQFDTFVPPPQDLTPGAIPVLARNTPRISPLCKTSH